MAKLSPQHKDDRDRAEELCRAARAFIAAKRPIPGHVISHLLNLKHVWSQIDVPAQVVAMEKRLPKNPQTAT